VLALDLASAVLDRAVAPDGSLHYEAEDGIVVDDQKPWWVGAEAVVGFLNAWQLRGGEEFFAAAERAWDFLEREVVDREHGEWLWYARSAPAPTCEAKVSQWKCPYHNGRMCFEVDRRLSEIERGATHGTQ
jgi:mannobiose 2-epimerase